MDSWGHTWDIVHVKASVLKGLPWAAQRKIPVSQNLIPSYLCPNLQARTCYLLSSPQGSDAISRTEWSGNEGRASSLIISSGSTKKEWTHWPLGNKDLGHQGVLVLVIRPAILEKTRDKSTSGWWAGVRSPLRRGMLEFLLSFSHPAIVSCLSVSSINCKLWESTALPYLALFTRHLPSPSALFSKCWMTAWTHGGMDEFLLFLQRKGDSGCWPCL